MIVELIATGSELLLGDTINTNVAYLGHELNRLGYTVAFHSTVGDNRARMEAVVRQAATRADIVICTGGLGPTQGDITRECVAKAIDKPLVLNEDAVREVKQFFIDRNREMPDASRRETILPEGSVVLHNSVGVAPGLAVSADKVTFILLPGPPSEMKAVFSESAVPYLLKRFGEQGAIVSKRYAVYRLRELELEERLFDLVKLQHNPTIAFLIKNGYIEVRLTASGKTTEEAQKLLAPWENIVEERLGDAIGRVLTDNLPNTVGAMLTARKATVATAESCTAGLVGKRLTETAGSSSYYMGGVQSYSNDVKHRLLGVPQDMLDKYGAVSEQVAKAMAEGAKKVIGTDYGVSTTGIAGPGGGTATKPVGLVWFGVAGPKGTVAFRNDFIGDRESIRQSAAEQALQYLQRYMETEEA